MLGDAGAPAHWETPGVAGEEPLDIWSRLSTTPLTQPSTTVAPRPDRTEIGLVLSAWRAAVRQLDEHIEAGPIRSAIQAEIDRLRAEYHRLFTQAAK
jgi:hypothetical protein